MKILTMLFLSALMLSGCRKSLEEPPDWNPEKVLGQRNRREPSPAEPREEPRGRVGDLPQEKLASIFVAGDETEEPAPFTTNAIPRSARRLVDDEEKPALRPPAWRDLPRSKRKLF